MRRETSGVIHLEAVTTGEQLAAIYELRHRVFVGEQGVSVEGERDALDTDPDTLHCIAYDDEGRVVGTGRLLAPVAGPDGHGNPHIGRVAVDDAARGTGVGRAVMDFLENEALLDYGRNGQVRVELSAQVHAAPFYERLGYVVHGDVYLDEGIEHRDAYKDVVAAAPAARRAS